jgi:hypothetical protein
MTMVTKTKQRLLQVGMGIGLICLAFLVEMVAIEPQGIYSYSHYGYKGFKIGISRERVLRKINKIKSIRTILTCEPNTELKLSSRRLFEMKAALVDSHIWICQDKKKNVFLFQFRNDRLDRILRLKGRFGKVVFSPLFDQCRTDIHQDIDGYLENQTTHKVFYKDGRSNMKG